MKKLTINWSELTYALDNSSYDFDYYLDTATGEVFFITEEARRDLETRYDEAAAAGGTEEFDLTAALAQSDLQDWRQQDVIEAHQIAEDLGRRYLSVPKSSSSAAFRTMRDFIYTVEDDKLQEDLWRAISGRGAFRYFKDTLAQDPAEQKRWYAYKEDRLTSQAREWLEENDIEPTNEPDRK